MWYPPMDPPIVCSFLERGGDLIKSSPFFSLTRRDVIKSSPRNKEPRTKIPRKVLLRILVPGAWGEISLNLSLLFLY